MKRVLGGLLVAMTVAAIDITGLAQAPAPQPPPPPPSVKVGQAVPDFSLPYMAPKAGGGYENKTMKLSEFKGKQNVVLAFFPAAFSPGCTKEMQQYHQTTGKFNASNTQISASAWTAPGRTRRFASRLARNSRS